MKFTKAVEALSQEQKKPAEKVPQMSVGDTVRVHFRIVEGEKERIQVFEGVVIRKCGSLKHAMFTVRKMSFGVGVERIYPLHSPNVAKIEVVRYGKVRRARLYYLREKRGKDARIKERRAAIEVAPQTQAAAA